MLFFTDVYKRQANLFFGYELPAGLFLQLNTQLGSVSYTHLDVYKRQVTTPSIYTLLRGLLLYPSNTTHDSFELLVYTLLKKSLKTVLDSSETKSLKSVSYTHLDVYKRQAF